MKIPKPEFELYEHVTLHWNGEDFLSMIHKRYFDPDENLWLYDVSGLKQLVTISNLSPR